MRSKIALLAPLAVLATAHTENGAGPNQGETMEQYAQRHMATEHHIDAFDARSFFLLHDLNSNGYWSRDEIEAVYGVHHPYSQARSADKDAHDAKAKQIVDGVLKRMDTDGDGVVSEAEFLAVGLEGLPDYSALGAEGHHYDTESEFFLHHEEQYHNTPETQTDEAYVHPEDFEHFEHHERIELEEENKERVYQGLDPLDKLADDHDQQPAAGEEEKTPLEQAAEEEAIKKADPNHITPMDGQGHVVPDDDIPRNPKFVRQPKPNPDTLDIIKAARDAGSKPAYGEGPEGYQRPKNKGDKMRRNLPYKYKFRRSWGDF